MAAFVVGLLLLLSIAGHSVANYCVCNSGLSDSVLQKNIDFSCANGADCSAIQPNGVCYNPNTVKSHCDYAVNSYFQRKQQTPGSCDFQGTAAVTPNPPSPSPGCVFPSGGGGATPTTPTTTPPTAGTPATGGATPTTPTLTPPAAGTPATGGATPTNPTTTPPATGIPAAGGTPPAYTGNGTTTTTPGTAAPPGMRGFTPPGFSLGPAGSALNDSSSDGVELLPLSIRTTTTLVLASFSFFSTLAM